jgi:hypothetical protein
VDDAVNESAEGGEHVTKSSKRLSETAAAKRLGVSRGTLANWRWRNVGPAYLKIGRRVEYLDDDIDAWEVAQRHDPAEASA